MSTTPQAFITSSESASTPEASEGDASCLLCYQDLSAFALTVCNHRDTCCVCNYRMRALLHDTKCPFCKVDSPVVVYTSRKNALFLEFSESQPQKDGVFSGIVFDSESVRSDLNQMSALKCQKCHLSFPNVQQLKSHLKTHGLRYCEICLRDKKVFLAEQVAYNSRDYMLHMKEGLNLPKPHPFCMFCHEYFFSEDEIFQHMTQKHYSCHICERSGRQYQYYKDYPSLEDHFSKEHYLCEHQSCLEKKFVVFSNEIELKAHLLRSHENSKAPRGSIQRISSSDLGFQYAPPPVFRRSNSRQQGSQLHEAASRDQSNLDFHQQHEFIPAEQTEPEQSPEHLAQSRILKDFEKFKGFCPFGSLSVEETRRRNQDLVKNLKAKCKKTPENYDHFRKASMQVQNGEVTSRRFMEIFIELFGIQSLELFLELANTVTSPEMQIELMREYAFEFKRRSDFPDLLESESTSYARPSAWSVVVPRTVLLPKKSIDFINCFICGLDVLRSDMQAHSSTHTSQVTHTRTSQSHAQKSGAGTKTWANVASPKSTPKPENVQVQSPAQTMPQPPNVGAAEEFPSLPSKPKAKPQAPKPAGWKAVSVKK